MFVSFWFGPGLVRSPVPLSASLPEPQRKSLRFPDISVAGSQLNKHCDVYPAS